MPTAHLQDSKLDVSLLFIYFRDRNLTPNSVVPGLDRNTDVRRETPGVLGFRMVSGEIRRLAYVKAYLY